MEPLSQTQIALGKLRELIATYFSVGEIDTICFDLDQDHENLPGTTKEDKARELVAHFARRGFVPKLLERCQKDRPNVEWWSVLEPVSPQPPPPPPKYLRVKYILVGIIATLAAIVILWWLIYGFRIPLSTPVLGSSPTVLTTTVAQQPSVSLVGLSYVLDEYDPRMVDLRKASTSGIPSNGKTLRLFDLWFLALESAPTYDVWVEIEANNQTIGTTKAKPLAAGLIGFDGVDIARYNDGNHPTAWRIQPDWRELRVFLITYHEGKVVNRNMTTIRLDAKGAAWLLDPPSMSFASIVYQVNDGPELVLDVRDVGKTGIEAKPGDKLALKQVWYDSNANSDVYRVEIEATLLAEGEVYSASNDQSTPRRDIQYGINKLDVEPLVWTIAPDRRYWDLMLVRSDGAVMDIVVVPLKSGGNAGLVRASDALMWPFKQVGYLDFESPSDLTQWAGTLTTSIGLSTDQAFTGKYALAVTTTASSSQGYASWNLSFRPTYIVGQVYWPGSREVGPSWAQVCLGNECASIPTERNRWNTFVMDVQELGAKQGWNPLPDVLQPYVQGEIDGVTKDKPYTFYIDGIQLSPASPRKP